MISPSHDTTSGDEVKNGFSAWQHRRIWSWKRRVDLVCRADGPLPYGKRRGQWCQEAGNPTQYLWSQDLSVDPKSGGPQETGRHRIYLPHRGSSKTFQPKAIGHRGTLPISQPSEAVRRVCVYIRCRASPTFTTLWVRSIPGRYAPWQAGMWNQRQSYTATPPCWSWSCLQEGTRTRPGYGVSGQKHTGLTESNCAVSRSTRSPQAREQWSVLQVRRQALVQRLSFPRHWMPSLREKGPYCESMQKQGSGDKASVIGAEVQNTASTPVARGWRGPLHSLLNVQSQREEIQSTIRVYPSSPEDSEHGTGYGSICVGD